MSNFFKIIAFSLVVVACGENNTIDEEDEYDGPMVEFHDVETMVSDSAVIKLKIKGAKQLTFQNGDLEYPEGVFIEFYDENSKVTSTIAANRGYYTKADNVYKVEEDVEVINFQSGEKLNSEELFWDPKTEKVHTEKFVNITTQTKIIKGVGLTASQDFSDYQIGKITGEIYLEEDF
ncbi:LPS export ABC transporter periplasmic protein LptC [Fulvivirgaceae bacterium BMA12]|uniref:LPS export ABC transporter periplasmic protein LptC n=1 Tax=Agaribacillus aureus TaxID=3051825 RepID=A0ABT8LEG5_9BACT|nr:LPS export ABC transporter periplasmic protein LptC [Fulvivirgaceae bacterium BMA12]